MTNCIKNLKNDWIYDQKFKTFVLVDISYMAFCL